MQVKKYVSIPWTAWLVCLTIFSGGTSSHAEQTVGVAAVDITPDYPVRLNGFGNRRAESEGVTQPIWAKALAFGDSKDPGSAAVIVTIDNLGVPAKMRAEVASRLEKKAKLLPTRLAITASHTHTAPMVNFMTPTLFGEAIPPEHQAHIDRYTAELTDKIERAALAALADRKPATLEFGIGSANFAVNRRRAGGPVDHDLPVLAVRAPDGTLRAIYTSYACHCVTLSNNKISGDWAGYVQETTQKNHPGVISLTSVGCGADANPNSGVVGDRADIAAAQGNQIAAEVDRLLKQQLIPIADTIATKSGEISLALAPLPTREQWQKTAEQKDAVGFHARVQLAKLDRGEKLLTEVPYTIQTWTFGDDLAMVFLPGEVVADYSLRLKRDFDRSRLWVNGYSNEAPCYIPSERVLKEGGYEGAAAMIYYDKPTKFAPGLEQKIIDEVHRQMPDNFVAPKSTEGIAPRSPEDSRRAMRTTPGLQIDLVASEPLVTSPVAIDWGADGKLWVCEMYDYPTGVDQNWQPGGRVKFLQDTDGDGQYDKATVFLDNLPFPTGITAWGRGAFVCAAPDIIYAEDTDGDGKADKIEKVFTGFATDNYQARVNSLSLGLDNWIYGANGLLGGTITGKSQPVPLDIRGHDFRFKHGGAMETVAGLTQQGRVRDDWGRWFGCDNSNALWYFPREQRYLARNPDAPTPAASIAPPANYDAGRVFPISRMLERFNHPDSANRMTSACGLGIYRDTLLGDEFSGNALTCEPVHNVVSRAILSGDEPSLSRSRAQDESDLEVVSSLDNWFRPVQAKTGPDGSLYVVDMYRFLIEHPRWIPAERLAQIDTRAGSDKGRLYRVRPAAGALRAVRDLTKLSAADLANALNSPNGTERDRVHIELLVREDREAVASLAKLAADAELPQVRLQALCAIDGLGGLSPAMLDVALKDADPHVRKNGVRLCEQILRKPGAPEADHVGNAVIAMSADPSPIVRHQVAYTLGEWNDPRAGRALGRLASTGLDDPEIRTAVLTSASRHSGEILRAVLATAENAPGRAQWIAPLIATAAGSGDEAAISSALTAALPADGAKATSGHFEALTSLLNALGQNGRKLSDFQDATPRVADVLKTARRIAGDESAKTRDRALAIKLLGQSSASSNDVELLCELASGASAGELRAIAITALGRQDSPEIAKRLLERWQDSSPTARADLVNLLLARDEWAAALLAAVRDGRVQRNEISLTNRQQLAKSENEKLRADAAATFPTETTSSRAEILTAYQSVSSLPGDASNGAELFAQQCASCHVLNDVGHAVGPDLSPLRDKDVNYFVQNILDPSAIIEPRFVAYQLVTNDRRSVLGIIQSETPAELKLIIGGGVTETVARKDVKRIRATPLSLMPEGLEAAFNPQQLADLIAYLKSGSRAKTFPGNLSAVVKAGKNGSLFLPAAAAEIRGGEITFESEFQNIGTWHGQDDQVAWTLEVGKAGSFDVYLDYACDDGAAGNVFALSCGGEKLTGKIAATGAGWSNYKQAKVGTISIAAGQQRLTVRPAEAIRVALLDLRTIALVPTGAKPAWPAKIARNETSDEVARDPASVAKIILDASEPPAAREAAITANPQFASELIVLMTRNLPPAAEYERIPWIWRVAIACGRRNDEYGIRKVLSVSLPQSNEPLRDWQAVVIGGGIINGISQRGIWPGPRIAEIIGKDGALLQRWNRSQELASAMTDDEKIRAGTRYDALRMIGLEPWEKRGGQLTRYLGKDVNGELQMGAVSGCVDNDSVGAREALLNSVSTLTEANRNLALDGLIRNPAGTAALLDAVAGKKIDQAMIGAERIAKLVNHSDPAIQKRAAEVFTKK